ncbi:hypothetical protein BOX15_Mlig015429g8, partial [Macrostomum lignano]
TAMYSDSNAQPTGIYNNRSSGVNPANPDGSQSDQLANQRQAGGRQLEYRGSYSVLPANSERRQLNQQIAERESQQLAAYVEANRPAPFTHQLGGGGGETSSGSLRRSFIEQQEAEMKRRKLAKYERATKNIKSMSGGRPLSGEADKTSKEPPKQQSSTEQRRDQMRQANAAFLDRVASSRK